jgi:hypothetical protein
MNAQHRDRPVRLGRPKVSPHVLGPRRLIAGKLLASLPAPAPARDWLAAAFAAARAAGAADLGVMHNDTLGDCTIAALGHAAQTLTANNGAMVTPTDAAILQGYETVDGYRPDDPSSDQGGVETAVLTAAESGIAGVIKIDAWIPVNPQNHDHMRKAVERFGGLYRGLSLPETIQQQPTRWTVDIGAKASAEAGSLGGHAVWTGAYNDAGLGTVTWGYQVDESWDFNDAYCDEAYAFLCSLWLPGGLSPLGDSAAALQADLAAVA